MKAAKDFTPVQQSMVKSLYLSGRNLSEIGRMYQCSMHTVRKLLVSLGVEIRGVAEARRLWYQQNPSFKPYGRKPDPSPQEITERAREARARTKAGLLKSK